MAAETDQEVLEDDQAPEGADGSRSRSKIQFPYGSLKDAEQIAGELHSKWGGAASPEQLAGGLGNKPRGGSFRIKVATARIFGAVSVSRGRISLTALGRRLVDPESQAAARVEAFLHVPLFNAVYEEYRGDLLPPDSGLEQQMVELGVSPKQTDKARQSLQRSADLAGFFQTSKGKLIQPPTVQDSGAANDPEGANALTTPQGGTATVPLPDLWQTLLDKGGSWTAEETQEFVDSARKMYRLLSKKAKRS